MLKMLVTAIGLETAIVGGVAFKSYESQQEVPLLPAALPQPSKPNDDTTPPASFAAGLSRTHGGRRNYYWVRAENAAARLQEATDAVNRSGSAAGQESRRSDAESSVPGDEQGHPQPPRESPFETTRKMQELAGTGGIYAIPALKLKGMAKDAKQALALLETDGGNVVLVREGEGLHLQVKGKNAVPLKVKRITSFAVVLEVGDSGQLIAVR